MGGIALYLGNVGGGIALKERPIFRSEASEPRLLVLPLTIDVAVSFLRSKRYLRPCPVLR